MLVHFNYDKKTGKQSCKASALESEMREPKFIFYFFFFFALSASVSSKTKWR